MFLILMPFGDCAVAALLNDENVEELQLLLLLDEEEDAVDTHALQNIDGAFELRRTVIPTTIRCHIPIMLVLCILVSNILWNLVSFM